MKINRLGIFFTALVLITLLSCNDDTSPAKFTRQSSSINSPTAVAVDQGGGTVIAFTNTNSGWYSLAIRVTAGKIRLQLDRQNPQSQIVDLGLSAHSIGIREFLLYIDDADMLLATVHGLQDDSLVYLQLDSESVVPQMPKLAIQSQCTECHTMEKYLVGPSFSDIAIRYRDDINARTSLTERVTRGGKGSWSELTGGHAMPANSPPVDANDVSSLVEYILALPQQDRVTETSVDLKSPNIVIEANQSYDISLAPEQTVLVLHESLTKSGYTFFVDAKSGAVTVNDVLVFNSDENGTVSSQRLFTSNIGSFSFASDVGDKRYFLIKAKFTSVITIRVQAHGQVSTNSPMPDLAKTSGCTACHAIDRKVVGPAWVDVAAFYANQENAREQLIEKVKKGGKGNWNEITKGVPMPPYSPRVADTEIATLVDYILGLNSTKP